MKTKINILNVLIVLALFLFAVIMILQDYLDSGSYDAGKILETGELTAEAKIERFARQEGLDVAQWPQELVKLLENNPETEEFVLNYPMLKDAPQEFDLAGQEHASQVPLLLQWDTRWGYAQYGDTVMGLSGCGPVCLSMVCIFLLEDAGYDPLYIARFSTENGYCVPGSGSAWTLISEGGVQLGLDVVEIPLDEDRLIRNLEAGNPVICVVGPGDFTTTGHFIVMTGYEDGNIKINDPNSKVRSERLWEYSQIKDQIRNLWVCRLP